MASKILWTYFYPDTRWKSRGAVLTLSSVPIVGKFFKIAINDAPSWIEMLLVPITYFDIGYITDKNFSFSIGTVYLWGLNLTASMPISKKIDFEVRSVLFLDKLLGVSWGIHSFFINFGLNYKFV